MTVMASIAVETRQPVPKKRKVSKDPTDMDDGKKRGRPRVEKNDESAADRRRTQIRMAQRAYRQRKESTLDELRRKVNELNAALESMGAVFQDHADRMVSFGLPDPAIHEMRVTASRLASIKETAMQSRDGSVEDEELNEPAPTSGPLTPKNVSVWLDQDELSRQSRRARIDDYLGLGYSIVLPDGHDEQPFAPFRTHMTGMSAPVPGMSPKLQPIPESCIQAVGKLETNFKQLQPPRTYSFQESTFGRRIHRACLESGYSLLLDPTRLPMVYERVFKLPLLGLSREQLTENTKMVLDRGSTEPLELISPPSIHIGGAGTHYPRRDHNGNFVKPKAGFNLGKVGSQTLKLLMHADEQRLTADMNVEIAGYEGEWFDAYDVEGYLAEKGVTIDPNSSFTELEIAEPFIAMNGSMSTSSGSRPSTPGLSYSSDERGSSIGAAPWKPLQTDHMAIVETSGNHDMVPTDMGGLGYVDANGLYVNFTHSTRLDSLPERPDAMSRPRKTVIVDVSKFIRGLMTSAVCLGQTPGFRRRDVDQALASACFDLF